MSNKLQTNLGIPYLVSIKVTWGLRYKIARPQMGLLGPRDTTHALVVLPGPKTSPQHTRMNTKAGRKMAHLPNTAEEL